MVEIRPERPADASAITAVTREAFAASAHGEQTEAAIIDALRSAHALSVSLVADDKGAIIGHAAFSPVQIEDGAPGWFGLGPVSVAPSRQSQGVGGRLIGAGLDRLRANGASGCVVLGDPAYYTRFGFQVRPGLVYEGAPVEYFQALNFQDGFPAGRVTYHDGFNAR